MLDGKRVGRRGQREISNGQRRLYSQFANKGGHVLVFHGQPPTTVQWLRQWLPGGDFVAETECDLDGLRGVVADWYVWANGMRPTPAGLHVVTDTAIDPVPRDEGEWDDVVTRRPPDWTGAA